MELESGSTGWISDYCETSFLINLTGTKFFCQLILTEIFRSLDATDGDTTASKNIDSVTTGAVEDDRDGVGKDAGVGFDGTGSDEGDTNMDMEDSSANGLVEDTLDQCGISQTEGSNSRENFYDMLTRKGNVDPAAAAFYSKNYTLYELLDFYSKFGC